MQLLPLIEPLLEVSQDFSVLGLDGGLLLASAVDAGLSGGRVGLLRFLALLDRRKADGAEISPALGTHARLLEKLELVHAPSTLVSHLQILIPLSGV